ncbi:lytic transglycosylase domain-containing protein [Kineococcus gynurae]|uniref:Lytic transglycosylase domain-containing protein n=1 Tax=Kineococcus gynurae TaxID=452979 RepID=A0ABV5LNH7_9ACTN
MPHRPTHRSTTVRPERPTESTRGFVRRRALAGTAVLTLAATVVLGASAATGPAPEAEAAEPDHLYLAAVAAHQDLTADAFFSARDSRAATNARIAEEQRLAAEAEAARLAEEARIAAAQEATRNAQRDPQAAAQALAADRGWGADQFGCLVKLWNKESGWRWDADNPSSSAYGIPQALPGKKMASAGADWETNPLTQITWGLGYIENRYGSPCRAWSHSQSVNWY